MLLDEIRSARVEQGAAMWWLGQMGYVIKTRKTTVLVDAFLTDRPDRLIPPAFDAAEADCFDVVLGSHDHDDHIDIPAWTKIAKANPGTLFGASELHRDSVCRRAGIDGARFLGLKPGETYTVGDVTIEVIPAAHEFLDRDAATGLYPHLSFVINGKIFHAGDTLTYDGQRDALRRYGRLDAMILPINGRDAKRYRAGCIGNMTFQEATDLAGELNPRLAIPGHWDMFAGNTANPGDFRDYLEAKYPDTPCIVPERYKRIDLA